MISRRAHAKINLFLRVGPPLPEGDPHAGLHPILSWMCPIDLHDEITFEPLPADEPSQLSIEWASDAPRPAPIDWRLDCDLVFRAHRALEEHAGRLLPMRIAVRKRIPVGAGLAGGSSDAACALRAINELCGLGLDGDALRTIGHTLGSDVPFFLDEVSPPRGAIVSHLGDRIERVESIPDERVLLILPPVACPTGEVYRAFDTMASPVARIDDADLRSLIARGGLPMDALTNDLLEPACRVEPRLREILEACSDALEGEPLCMSGSGSTLWCRDTPQTRTRLEALAAPMDLVLCPARLGAGR